MAKAKKIKGRLIDTIRKYIRAKGFLKKMLRAKLIRQRRNLRAKRK